MLTEPLTRTLDVRKAAARGATVSGRLDPHQLPRFRELLAEDGGNIEASLEFLKDEENRYLIRSRLRAEVFVTCQRCLRSMPLTLETGNDVAVVWSDEQAGHLPRHLDPLIMSSEEPGSLWDLVEEELMLAMPAFSYHESEDCNESLADYTAGPGEPDSDGKSNPFNVLAQLKPGNNTRS